MLKNTFLAIIPQEPILFNGTLRSNLDPWNSHTDVKLWDVIHKLRFSKIYRLLESNTKLIFLVRQFRVENRYRLI